MSLATIRDPILTKLGMDQGSSLVQDVKERIRLYIIDAIDEINAAGKWEILKTTGLITTVDNIAVYSLPSDCDITKIVNNKLYIISQQKQMVKETDQKMVENLLKGDSGLPSEWRPYGKDSSNNDQIQVYPTPNTTYAGLIINFEYTKDLTALVSDTDTSPFHEAIIRARALAKYLAYDDDLVGAKEANNAFAFLLKKALARNKGNKRFIVRIS